MNILSLFAGIGGLELGLERAGLGTTRWQVELEPFNRKVLAAHWPDAERFADVRDVSAEDFPGCDVICGGFPCQDISLAGKGEGIDGQRSGLWREFARLIGEIRPRIVVVENVPDLAVRGLGRVLG
ncbi:MAG: DNA cytosine methyltransferase, partial [Myxococcales bacterium]|nr:DNA cytosine methyltransferase [Myxococcales bacterium]